MTYKMSTILVAHALLSNPSRTAQQEAIETLHLRDSDLVAAEAELRAADAIVHDDRLAGGPSFGYTTGQRPALENFGATYVDAVLQKRLLEIIKRLNDSGAVTADDMRDEAAKVDGADEDDVRTTLDWLEKNEVFNSIHVNGPDLVRPVLTAYGRQLLRRDRWPLSFGQSAPVTTTTYNDHSRTQNISANGSRDVAINAGDHGSAHVERTEGVPQDLVQQVLEQLRSLLTQHGLGDGDREVLEDSLGEIEDGAERIQRDPNWMVRKLRSLGVLVESEAVKQGVGVVLTQATAALGLSGT